MSHMWQEPVKPGSQSAANWSVGRPAGRQVAATAAQPGSQGILLASQQAGIWPACPSNGQAGRLPKRGWPARLTALEACQSQSHLGRQYRKACQTPEKKRLRESPDPGKKIIIWLACQSATEASSNAAQLCTQQFARRLASKPGPTFGPSALSGTSHPIGRPAARALRQ